MRIRIERHDSPLGRWRLARWSPETLASPVSGMWYFEGELAYRRERHFPAGLVDLIVHLGPVYRWVDGERSERFTPTCVSGLLLRPEVIEAPPGPSAVLGIALRPAGALRVLGRPLHELTGWTADLADVLPGAAGELAERCARAATPEGRLRAASRWIAERIRSGPQPPAAISWAADELERRAGALSIDSLRTRTGWSKTRFTTTFREQVGVPPKVLARIFRFRNALALVDRGDTPLADVALAAGYYDQPHFNAEFRELSGFTPREYLARIRYPESVNLAEAAP